MSKNLESALRAVEKSNGETAKIVFMLARIRQHRKPPVTTIAGIAADLEMDHCRENFAKFKERPTFGPQSKNFRIERLFFGRTFLGYDPEARGLSCLLIVGGGMTLAAVAVILGSIISKLLGV